MSSYVRDIWERARYGAMHVEDMPSRIGMAALRVAASTEGWGERGGNNIGPRIEQLREYRGPRGAWCAAAVSYWLRMGARDLGLPLPPRVHSAKRLCSRLVDCGARRVVEPLPGDVVLWHRGPAGARTGHVGLVASVDVDRFRSWEGNRGPTPAAIRTFEHSIADPGLLGFFRV